MNYYKRHIGDYHKKAGRLTMLEHGAYTLLIDACYDRERFPTFDDAVDWCWARTDDEISAVKFVLSRFFELENGVYKQLRIEDEIKSYLVIGEKNAEIAKAREEKKRLLKEARLSTERERSVHEACEKEHGAYTLEHAALLKSTETAPNHKPLTTNHKPLTTNQEKKNKSPTVQPTEVFKNGSHSVEKVKEKKIQKKEIVVLGTPLPQFIDASLWKDFCDFRVRLDSESWTQRAHDLNLKKLLALKAKGYDANEIIETTLANGWKGFFEPKTNGYQHKNDLVEFNGQMMSRAGANTARESMAWINENEDEIHEGK